MEINHSIVHCHSGKKKSFKDSQWAVFRIFFFLFFCLKTEWWNILFVKIHSANIFVIRFFSPDDSLSHYYFHRYYSRCASAAILSEYTWFLQSIIEFHNGTHNNDDDPLSTYFYFDFLVYLAIYYFLFLLFYVFILHFFFSIIFIYFQS